MEKQKDFGKSFLNNNAIQFMNKGFGYGELKTLHEQELKAFAEEE